MCKLEPVGLVGTGLFGTALVHRLLDTGYPTRVFNRTREKAQPLLDAGAVWSDNPLAECRVVIFSVYTVDQVARIYEQMNSRPLAVRTIIDTSTSDPQQTTAMGEWLAAKGVSYLEAPFSGSSEQARRREATALVAGDKSTFDACSELWQCLSAKSFYLGGWGNAARMKLVTNLVLGLNRAVLAEGLVFAEAVGLEMSQALQVLMNSAASSRTMEAKGPKMIEGDFTPQARLSQHLKDVRLILEEAARGGISLPVSSVHLKLLELAESRGYGDSDNSAVIHAIRNSNLVPNSSTSHTTIRGE